MSSENKIIRNLLVRVLNLSQKDKVHITPIGGMTNTNYLVVTETMKVVLRLPGMATEHLINHSYEKNNSKLAATIGINTETIYFDSTTGIKITTYIPNAETLSPSIVRKQDNIEKISFCFRRLHQSNVKFANEFNVFSEYKRYKDILLDLGNAYCSLPHYKAILDYFHEAQKILQKLDQDRCPCHNDLVAANIVKSGDRIYLIDWEYSGMNDPMWDLASHFLECQFTPEEEKIFLTFYFAGNIPDRSRQKILLFKFTQDVLWTFWTAIKEKNGNNFGDYGINRFKNAYQLMYQYQYQYEK